MRERPARANLEFGGASGAAAVILLSHVTVYYVLLCVAASDGALYPLPRTLDGWRRAGRDLARLASPTPGALAAYLAWLGAQVGLAEGVELHLLGLTLGVDLWPPQVKLPFLPAIPWQLDG